MDHYKAIFILIFLISAFLFFAPIHTAVGSGFNADKIVHAAIFAALVYSALKAFPRVKILAVISLCFYGYAVEFIQGKFLPRRHFDWMDITADVVGLVIGLLVFVIGISKLKKQ